MLLSYMLMLFSVFVTVLAGFAALLQPTEPGDSLFSRDSLEIAREAAPDTTSPLMGVDLSIGDASTSEEPLAVSREQYEAALNQPAAEYLGSAPSTTVQGLEVHFEEYDSFFPYIVLGVSLPEIPGLDRLTEVNEFAHAAALTVNRVLDATGKDVYDREHSFEEAPFDGLGLRSISDLPGYLEGMRQVHVKKGVQEKDLRSVDAQVVLKLPINIQALEFAPTDLGKEKKSRGAVVSLSGIDETEYRFDYLGKWENFVKFIGYDAQGGVVPIASRTSGVEDAGSEPTPVYVTFEAPVTTIKMFIADEIYTKTIPFTLKLGK